MKKHLKTATVNEVYVILDSAKYTNMEPAERRALVKAMRPLKKIYVEFTDFRDDAVKRLRPDNYEEVAHLVDEFNRLAVDARISAMADPKYASAIRTFNVFQSEIAECLSEEAVREHELEYEPLTSEAIDRLLDSNTGWTVGQAMLVEEALGNNE